MTKKRVLSVFAIIFGIAVAFVFFQKFMTFIIASSGSDPHHGELNLFDKDYKDVVSFFKVLGKTKVGLMINVTRIVAIVVIVGGLATAAFAIVNMVIPAVAGPILKIVSVVEIIAVAALFIAGIATTGASFYSETSGGTETMVFLFGWSGYFNAFISGLLASIFGMTASKKLPVLIQEAPAVEQATSETPEITE